MIEAMRNHTQSTSGRMKLNMRVVSSADFKEHSRPQKPNFDLSLLLECPISLGNRISKSRKKTCTPFEVLLYNFYQI